MKKILFLAITLLLGFNSFGQKVLLIYDVINANTTSLKTALETAGFTVTYSQTNQSSFNGSNPSTSSFDAIIHLNGTTYGQGMPTSGQQALLNFVNSGGCFIASEWNAYDASRFTTMSDLILFTRTVGFEGQLTYNQVAGQSTHPILASIPLSFNFNGGTNRGQIKNFAVNPVDVLMTEGTNPAVAYRKLGFGSVVNFSHAGNYSTYNTLSDLNVQKLYINSVIWGMSNRALAFDGLDDRVELATPLVAGQSYTKEAWVYALSATNGATNGRNIISSSGDPFWLQNGSLYAGNGNSFFEIQSPNFPLNKWTHVAVTFDAANSNTMKLYKDGILVATKANAQNSTGGTVAIGNYGTGDGFQGMIDDVRIWNTVRTDAEIAQSRTATITSGTGLVASYNFNQGIAGGDNTAINTLTDGSSNANNGTLQNFDKTNGNLTSNFVSSYAMVIPTATAASSLGVSGFTANWTTPTGGTATSYILEYAINSNFTANVASVTVNALTYNITNLKPGTTYYYRVSAVSGTTVGGYSNVISATTTTLAPPGNALAFDNGQFVDINGGSGVQLGTNFTEEAWIYTTASDGAHHSIIGSGDNNGYLRGPSMYIYNGTYLHGGFGTGSNWISYYTNSVLKPNAWNHIAQTFDGNNLKLYVNGVEIQITLSSSASGAVPNNNGLVTRLGYIDNYFQGRMDEVRLWSVARTAQQIKDSYSQFISPNTAGLVAYYNFDQGVANQNNAGLTTLYDQTANGNVGTLHNFALNFMASNWVGSYAVNVPVATSATAVTVSGFTANWNVLSGVPITGYQLEYSDDVTFQTHVASVTTNTNSYTFTGMNPRMTYYYRVRAVNGSDIGGPSNSISLTTGSLTPPGNALDFRGGKVAVTASQTIQGSYTVSLWAKPATTNGYAGLFGSRIQNGNTFDIQLGNGNQIHGDIGDGSNWYTTSANANFNYKAGEWVYIAYAVSPTGYKIYANGDKVGEGTYLGTPKLVDATKQFEIGFNGYDYFNGAMDEVRVYNTALTDEEIKTDWLSLSSTKPANLVAHYDFDQGVAASTNTIVDKLYNKVGSDYQGALTGFNLYGNTSNWIGTYALTVPQAASATQINTKGFTANWTAPNLGIADGYVLEYGKDRTFNSGVNTVVLGASSNSYAVTNLQFGASYYYRVRATNSQSNEIGAASNVVVVTTNAMTPTTNALNFDGVDDYVGFDQKAVTIAGQSWTLEGWVKTAGNSAGIFGINDGDNVWEPGEKVFYLTSNGYPTFVGWGANYIVSTQAINDDKWHHVAVMYNATNATSDIFVDGVSVKSSASNYNNGQPDMGLPNFGKPNYGGGEALNYFSGSLDQFRIWDRALSAAEIVDGLDKTIPTNNTGLKASYNFSQGIANGDNTNVLSLKDELDIYRGTLNGFAKTGTSSNFVGTNNYPMEVAVATAATSVTTNSFVANWTAPASISATTYYLDVATDAAFANLVAAYTNTGNVSSFGVTALTPGSTYYYRVRANSEYFGTAINSNVISATIDKVDQTITLAASNTVTYGAMDYALGATSTNSSIPLTYTSSDNSIATVSSTGTVHVIRAGNVTITVGQPTDAQYNAAATVTQNLVISKKALVLTATAPNRTYDATTASTATISVSGTVNGDLITASATTAIFNDKTVATGKTVTVSGITITGTRADSYSSAVTATTAATITQANIVVSITSPNKVYDATNASTATLSITGVVSGDVVTATAASATFNDKAVGNGKMVTAGAITLNGTDAANYSYNTTATTTANITRANIIVGISAPNKVYDSTSSSTATLSLSGVIASDVVTATAASATFANKIVGNGKTVTAGIITLNGTDAANYSYNATATTTANITAKNLLVSVAGVNKVYDGNTSATVTVSDNRLAGDSFSVNIGAAGFSDRNVATGKTVMASNISISGTDAANYSVNTTATTTANITSRSLLVSVAGVNKVYDGNTSATVTVSDNRLAGDILTVGIGAAAFSDRNVATGKTVTVSGISISGTDAGNYTVNTTATTTANITSRSLLVSVAGVNKVYDGNTSATVTVSDNRLAGDSFSVNIGAAAFSDRNVATGKTVTASNISISGTDAVNYTVNTTATTTANITARALVVAASASDKVYDGNATATASLTDNRIAGDVLNSNYATATFNNANVGTGKAVAVTGISISGTDANNYMANTTAATAASITPRALTITADNKSRLQGAANPTLTVSYNGFIAGQNNTNALSTQANITTTATTASLPGNYPITASGAVAANSNYAISYVSGTMTVNQAAVTGISLAGTTLYENRPAGTVAGTLSGTSTDPAATFTYTLVGGAGSTDNGRFAISGNQVVTAGPLDFEAQASYAIRVRSTTQFGFFTEQAFTISINDVNEAPTMDAVAGQTICYTTGTQNIALTGITPGPESAQNVTMAITTDNPGLFRNLTVSKGNGTNGTFSYSISNGWQGTAVVSITLRDNGGTANSGANTYTRTFNITVNPLPVTTIWSSSGINSVSKGETISLKADAPGAVGYSWSNAGGIISGQNTATLTIRPTQTTTYTVTALNATGCSESKQITIEVRGDFNAVKANNILTPNGDGSNDTWFIANIDQYPNAEVKVFDRSGRIVFQRKGYDNSWNGTFNGTLLNEGAYMYVIDFGNGLYKAKGTLTILHNQ